MAFTHSPLPRDTNAIPSETSDIPQPSRKAPADFDAQRRRVLLAECCTGRLVGNVAGQRHSDQPLDGEAVT